MDDAQDTGIPWLTDHQRDFLAHLLTLTIQDQLKPHRSYQRISDALENIAADGLISMQADDTDVWVLVCGESIVHAARDWLEWMTPRWANTQSN
jgi:hypothetical protein